MRGTLEFPGGPDHPDLDKARQYGINHFFFAANDPVVTPEYIDWWHSEGFSFGLQVDPTWYAVTDLNQLPAIADQKIRDLKCDSKQLTVLFDVETHNPSGILSMLTLWRALRPTRDTIWTMEPFQGGWMRGTGLPEFCNRDGKLKVAVQDYFGSPRLYPVAPAEAARDLIRAGFGVDEVVDFSDGERFSPPPARWNGIIYNFLALP